MNDTIFLGIAWLAYRQGQWNGFFLFFGLAAFGTIYVLLRPARRTRGAATDNQS